MYKLMLALDELQVESFDVGADALVGRGTVEGQSDGTLIQPPDPDTQNVGCVSRGCFNSYIYGARSPRRLTFWPRRTG
jgi:hypothetical protein